MPRTFLRASQSRINGIQRQNVGRSRRHDFLCQKNRNADGKGGEPQLRKEPVHITGFQTRPEREQAHGYGRHNRRTACNSRHTGIIRTPADRLHWPFIQPRQIRNGFLRKCRNTIPHQRGRGTGQRLLGSTPPYGDAPKRKRNGKPASEAKGCPIDLLE